MNTTNKTIFDKIEGFLESKIVNKAEMYLYLIIFILVSILWFYTIIGRIE